MASLRSGVWVNGLFGVQRDPVLKGRRLVNFANPWLLMLSGFQGFCCLSLAPGMATTWVRDHHLYFRTCSLFSVKRRVGEEMRGNLIGTWGVQSWDLAQEPRQDHQPTKNKGLLAARSVRRRSRRLDPKKNTRRRPRTKLGFPVRSWILPCWRLGEGPIGIAQVGCLGQRPFWCSAGSCSERPPSRQVRESFASAAFWVSGVRRPERGPCHGYYLGQGSQLGFLDLLPLQCGAPGWGRRCAEIS